MPCGHSEGTMWGITREKKKKRESSHERLHLAAWPTHRTKDWRNTKGGLAGCVQAPIPHPPLGQRGRCVTARSGRQGAAAVSAPEMVSSTKLWAGSQLLATSSWDPGWLTSTRRLAAWDQLPRGAIRHIGFHSAPRKARCTWETKWPAPGRWLRCMAHLGQALGFLSCSDLGRAQNTCPARSVPLQSTWEPEWLRPGKCTKHKAHFGQCPCRAPWSLSSVDPESTHRLKLWQTQCGPYSASTPSIWQFYLFAASLPPHNKTEQVSLNKWPPLPPCVRVAIRHWRDLQTEEEEGTAVEVTSARMKILSLTLTVHWRGPKLEQGIIWNQTDPTLPTTAPEKLLDIFLLWSL